MGFASENWEFIIHFWCPPLFGFLFFTLLQNKRLMSAFSSLLKGTPITSASYYATVTLDEVRQIFRSDTEFPMPLMEERHRVLNETGKILLEKFGGSFLNCVRKSKNSAQELMSLVVEHFPSYRDVTEFEVSFIGDFRNHNPPRVTFKTHLKNKNVNFEFLFLWIRNSNKVILQSHYFFCLILKID